jgi:hypothetical protein
MFFVLAPDEVDGGRRETEPYKRAIRLATRFAEILDLMTKDSSRVKDGARGGKRRKE